MSLSMWSWLAGCQSSLEKAPEDIEGYSDPEASGDVPRLALQSPPAAAFLAAEVQPVEGIAQQVEDVAVNGHPASVSEGRFSASVPLPVGVTTLEVTGTDPQGLALTDSWSVLAGEFATPDGKLADAVQVQVSADSLSGLGGLVGGLLDPAALGGSLTALNPVIDSATARVDLAGLEFGTPLVEITPGNGVLDVTISIPDFVLGLEATLYGALPFGLDLELAPDLVAEELRLSTTLALSPDGQGGLDASVGPLDVQIVGFALDTGILELVEWLVLDEDDLTGLLESQLGALGPLLEPAIDAQLDQLDLAMETELMGASLSFVPWIDSVDIDPAGLGMSVGVILEVSAPEPDLPGHLTFAPPPPLPAQEVAVQVSDAFMNRALYELWAGGALNMDLPLEADDAAILFLFGGQDQGRLTMSSALPPVWLERDGLARLQLGEMALNVETPGGSYGERVELMIALDARAEIVVSGETAGVVLSEASVHMRAVGESAENAALKEALPTLVAAFGLGIGVVNEQLSFPLTDLLGGLVLPELAFERDPSGLGTRVQLSVDDLLGLVGMTPAGPGPTSGAVAIPGTATVSDGDFEVTTDAEQGWICGGDEIEASGDGGTWYVDPGAELTVTGTGHTVYATAGAQVQLEGPGNTVYADPQAEIEDQDGSNTITVLDPLQFDLTSAPTPGC
jgi:hypothetical protein